MTRNAPWIPCQSPWKRASKGCNRYKETRDGRALAGTHCSGFRSQYECFKLPTIVSGNLVSPLTPSDSRACQALKLKYGRRLYDHEQLIMNFATSHDCIAIVITEQKRHRGMFRILVEH